MKLKPIVCTFSLLISLCTPIVASAKVAVGTFECSPYDSRDTRPQPPKTSLTKAFIDSRNTGYVLQVTFNDERGRVEIPLNSELHLISNTANPYTMKPLKVSPDGKFKITILGKSNVCTYSGIAQLSRSASARLFGSRRGSNP